MSRFDWPGMNSTVCRSKVVGDFEPVFQPEFLIKLLPYSTPKPKPLYPEGEDFNYRNREFIQRCANTTYKPACFYSDEEIERMIENQKLERHTKYLSRSQKFQCNNHIPLDGCRDRQVSQVGQLVVDDQPTNFQQNNLMNVQPLTEDDLQRF